MIWIYDKINHEFVTESSKDYYYWVGYEHLDEDWVDVHESNHRDLIYHIRPSGVAHKETKMKQKNGGFSCHPFVWGYLSDWKDVA